MNADDLFTAPQVAKICSTDLKTIHNWVHRGEIKSFRTPGRHLRFRRQDVLEFLHRYGYPVPNDFAPARQRVVLYETRESSLRSIKRSLAKDFEVEAFDDVVDALLFIGEQRPSLVLISGDANNGEKAMHLVARLTGRSNGFPVAVYSADATRENEAREAGATAFIASADSKEIRRQLLGAVLNQ